MKYYSLKWSVSILMIFSLVASSEAQFRLPESPSTNQFLEAKMLFEKEKYAAARLLFEEIIEPETSFGEATIMDAHYFICQCAIRMNEKDAELLLKEFATTYPFDERINQLYFEIGHLQYQEKKYSKTINWFEILDKSSLDKEQRYTYQFELGYSYFVKEMLDEAAVAFYEIIHQKGDYFGAANYFYAHIAYTQENYQTALNTFSLLRKDEDFQEIVPYYLIQINFILGNYEEIKSSGPALLAISTDKRVAEINHLIGEAYYRTGEYGKALPYLQAYKEKSADFTREDIYELAYAYYAVQKYPEAIANFEKVARSENHMAQNAYFHMADCYLKLGDKTKAYMAFGAASKMNFDAYITEESFFNYAKLSFELSYSPFNQTVKIFDDFLRKYPESEYKELAYDYLIKVFMKTKNYGQAIVYLDKIDDKSEAIKLAYQRAAFYRGAELFLDNDFKKAIGFFDKSLNYDHLNPELKAQAIYWKAEANYRLGDYNTAIDGYTLYLRLPGALNQPEYASAHYNLAYTYFQQKQFEEAISWFRKYIAMVTPDNMLLADANLRVADCYFKTRQFAEAVKSYDQALKLQVKNGDYAMFQKAFSFGLLKEYTKKNWVLRQMIETYPNSNYKVDAMFEIGKSYHDLGDYENAIKSYQALIKDFPNSQHVMEAGNQIALIEYNRDNTEAALVAFKWVVEQFPQTQEARAALESIERIYIDGNRNQEYFAYRDGLTNISALTVSEKDSLAYLSAEQLYMKADYAKAVRQFSDYIRDFASGAYLLEAHYRKADCNLRLNDEPGAMASFQYINSVPVNKYSEESLYNSGKINLKNKNYQAALNDFRTLEMTISTKKYLLESRIAQMQSYYALNNPQDAITTASVVLASESVPAQTIAEAHYILGKSYLAVGNPVEAINEFKYIAENTQTLQGAEANYLICQILFDQQKIEECEKEILQFNQKGTPHQYWLAKSIILLSDVYLVNNDLFQARHTLESVVQYYGNQQDGIVSTAGDKLNLVIEREELENQFKESLEPKEPINE